MVVRAIVQNCQKLVRKNESVFLSLFLFWVSVWACLLHTVLAAAGG